ncbi:hypothetical protein Y1Q_0016437 [Alligator mississippiensis]|uniref:Uncharacterized protein n=1 Tax=Alligator mississippiensis TaxID=8496 RepID=A0A151N374_ALLMI|nr:hypothetical protein Y1Q_0016437 [Alligator mississippiensis]
MRVKEIGLLPQGTDTNSKDQGRTAAKTACSLMPSGTTCSSHLGRVSGFGGVRLALRGRPASLKTSLLVLESGELPRCSEEFAESLPLCQMFPPYPHHPVS